MNAEVSLTQVVNMNQDKEMAAKWLSENVDSVLQDLTRAYNMEMAMALMWSMLRDNKTTDKGTAVERVQKILLEYA